MSLYISLYNFYQSLLRKTINTQVYKKPTCNILLFGKEYQCIMWEKWFLGVTLRRIQILWVENLAWHTSNERKQELLAITKKYKPLFIQLGCIDTIGTNTRKQLQDENIVKDLIMTRQKRNTAHQDEWFRLSLKENLPPSTYIIDLTIDREILYQNLGSQHTQKIKKALKSDIHILPATKQDITWFFSILQNTGQQKWFGTISIASYNNLLQWLQDNNCWWLYVAKKWDTILAWAVYLIDEAAKTAIYLYWATDRSSATLGASHLLHREIWETLRKSGIHTIDLLGWAPTGYDKHHLASVWAFKEWFGGMKIDFLGSFDIVYHPILYKIRCILRNLSK